MITMENISAMPSKEGAASCHSEHRSANSPGVLGDGIPPGEIRHELARIISSPDFAASPRNRRALEYLVQCYLEGREDQLTAYHIATRIFNRPPTFDRIKDPIVRIEMAGLRRHLEMYYLKSGARNPLRISIPKGGYVPRVTRRVGPEPSSEGATCSPFLVLVLRAALFAWSGLKSEASAAWQDVLRTDPSLLANLHGAVLREIGDEEVTRLIVEGVLHAARRTA